MPRNHATPKLRPPVSAADLYVAPSFSRIFEPSRTYECHLSLSIKTTVPIKLVHAAAPCDEGSPCRHKETNQAKPSRSSPLISFFCALFTSGLSKMYDKQGRAGAARSRPRTDGGTFVTYAGRVRRKLLLFLRVHEIMMLFASRTDAPRRRVDACIGIG